MWIVATVTMATCLLLKSVVDDDNDDADAGMLTLTQGSVEFVESNEFRIEVNATSSSVEHLARFHYNFTDFHGSLLLQMVRIDVYCRRLE